MREGNSPMISTFQKGAGVKNGGVAKTVEAALIGETVQKEERFLEINEKGRFGKTYPALCLDDHGRDDRI